MKTKPYISSICMPSYNFVAASGVEQWWFENGGRIGTLFRVVKNFHFIVNNLKSVVNPIPFLGNNLLATVGHSVYDLPIFFFGDRVSGFRDSFPVFDHTLRRRVVIPVEPVLEKNSHVLYRIEIGRLRWPFHDFKPLV